MVDICLSELEIRACYRLKMVEFIQKKWVIYSVAVLLLVAASLALTLGFQSRAISDPDRYYHLAVSRMEASEGRLKKLVQAEDIGWNKSFPEKEWLFHEISSVAYRISGEDGVLAIVPLIVTATILLLFLEGAALAGPQVALGAVLACVFLCPPFLDRLILLRPYLLAILFFLCILIAALHKWRGLAFLGSALFTLSYHAVFVPCIVLGCCFGLGILSDPKWRYLAYWGFLGVICGILINPYFPLNLEMMFIHISIASDLKLSWFLRSGREIYPIDSWVYLRFYLLPWVILVSSSVLLFRNRRKIRNSEELQKYAFLTLLSAIFLMLTFRSIRAAEYSTLCYTLLAAMFLKRLFQERHLAVGLGASVWILFEIMHLHQFYSTFLAPAPITQNELVFEALQKLPLESKGRKIYNCDWAYGSLILYARPDLRFVDLMDPHFLYYFAPESFLLQRKLERGEADPFEVISGHFKAQYVLCNIPEALRALRKDSRFKQIFPTESENRNVSGYPPYLFVVKG